MTWREVGQFHKPLPAFRDFLVIAAFANQPSREATSSREATACQGTHFDHSLKQCAKSGARLCGELGFSEGHGLADLTDQKRF
jgi:hypothetical protein